MSDISYMTASGSDSRRQRLDNHQEDVGGNHDSRQPYEKDAGGGAGVKDGGEPPRHLAQQVATGGYPQFSPYGPPSGLAPSYHYASSPQHSVRKSYNDPHVMAEQPYAYAYGRPSYTQGPQAKPSRDQTSEQPHTAMAQAMPAQYLGPYPEQTEFFRPIHPPSHQLFMGHGPVPAGGYYQQPVRPPISSSSSPAKNYEGKWSTVSGGNPPQSDASATNSSSQRAPGTVNLQPFPGHSDSAENFRQSNLGTQAAEGTHAGSRPGTSEGIKDAVKSGILGESQTKQSSEGSMLSWDEASYSGSRPVSSSGGNQSQDQGLRTSDPHPRQVLQKMQRRESDEPLQFDPQVEEQEKKMDHRKRKRNRTIRSCVPCHNHKRKCDRKRPCGRCTALGLTGSCVYEIDELRDMNDPEVAEADRLRRRIAELELVVRELRQRAPPRNAAAPGTSTPSSSMPALTVTPTNEGEHDDKRRRVIVNRFARFMLDEAKAAANLGVSMGHSVPGAQTGLPHEQRHSQDLQQIEEKAKDEQGQGTNTDGKRDYRAEPYSTHLLPGDEVIYDRNGRQVFLGASAGKSMLRRLKELAVSKNDGGVIAVPEEVAFTGIFPNLRKTFPFTTIWSHENFCAEIIGLLPSQEQSDVLWTAWDDTFESCFDPFYKPGLRAEYSTFFSKPDEEKMTIPLSSLAVYLMICALGCLLRATTAEIYGHPDRDQRGKSGGGIPSDSEDLTSSRLQSELYLSATYQALRLCAFMANPTVPALQSQFLIQVYLLASERAADAWAIGGNMIKQAVALGLHRDPLSLDPNISMRDAETKRRLWWSIAGFDAMLAIIFGRPGGINFYMTHMPQDLPDEDLSEALGSARAMVSPSNTLNPETTDQSYHAAYYRLTIPAFQVLEGIFDVGARNSRSGPAGCFPPCPSELAAADGGIKKHTYQDSLTLASNITEWYKDLPRGLRLDLDDTADYLTSSRSMKRINQTLVLCIQSWTLVLVLHRPYLRVDHKAYPESTECCAQSAHMVLKAYKAMLDTKSTLCWSIWTMPYRAFQAGAVCAFLALRQPGTELAAKCLVDLRGAVAVFEDRLSTWISTHPVQSDLRQGLVQLENLVTLADEQHRNASLGSTTSLYDSDEHSASSIPTFSGSRSPRFRDAPLPAQGAPLSHVRAFPAASPPPPGISNFGMFPVSGPGGIYGDLEGNGLFQGQSAFVGNHGLPPSHMSSSAPFPDDFNGPSPLALSGIWASMFGIKVDNRGKDSSMPGIPGMSWS